MPADVTRVSWGFDAHRLGGPPPLVLGGIVVDEERGVHATSDGDVAAHAVADALLAVCGLGDLGEHFPSEDPQWENADSMGLLERVVEMCPSYVIEFVDVTVVAEEIRVSPHRSAIAASLAARLRVDQARVSVKATTTDGMGFIGRGEGLAAVAVVTTLRSE